MRSWKTSKKKSHKGRWRYEIVTEKRSELEEQVGDPQIMEVGRTSGFTEQNSQTRSINGY